MESKGFGDFDAVCVMDAGDNDVILLADTMLPPCNAAARPDSVSAPDETRCGKYTL
jgi:hypothetical protein